MAENDITMFDIAQIWNCEHAFENQCPKEWASLDRTETHGVRYCHECKMSVTFCNSPEEFVKLGNAGHCVAIPEDKMPGTLQMAIMGRPSPESVRALEERQMRIEKWWTTAIESEPIFSLAAIATVKKAIRLRNTPWKLPPKFQKYIDEIDNAVRNGPDALYLYLRAFPFGNRPKHKTVFEAMERHFPMTFPEYQKLANRLDESNPQ